MTRRALVTGCLVFLAALGGCHGGGGPAPAVETTILTVDNQRPDQMTIYLVTAGTRFRIGTAYALRKTDLTIPPSLVRAAGDLSFLADPVGSNRVTISNAIYVEPGTRVTLILPP